MERRGKEALRERRDGLVRASVNEAHTCVHTYALFAEIIDIYNRYIGRKCRSKIFFTYTIEIGPYFLHLFFGLHFDFVPRGEFFSERRARDYDTPRSSLLD